MPNGPRTVMAALGMLLPLLATGCAPSAQHADLAPTLGLAGTPSGSVAVQNGMAVPSFDRQPRPTIDLGGAWRVEPAVLDVGLTLRNRQASLAAIEGEAAGRHTAGYDDGSWATMVVPGPLNPPPERREGDAWLRRRFTVPPEWEELAATLKFGAVNYVADVWLNGVHLGYHEGGYTPFAFRAEPALLVGGENVLVVRVANPPWGSRNDIMPWGLTDWWNFGGITRAVWLEASSEASVPRVDVVPHLDGADVKAVVENRGGAASEVALRLRIHPARVDEANLLEPLASALVPPDSVPVAETLLEPVTVEPGAMARLDADFAFRDADWWSPDQPALYVIEAELLQNDTVVDRLVDSFGLRTIQVDPAVPDLLLNAEATTFRGAALHDQYVVPSATGPVTSRMPTDQEILVQLTHAREAHVDLIRTGHTPPNPTLLRLADRLGFAAWTEIPLYHYTPLTFEIALNRGIAQQMLREMALRDMNRPSVLFHGLANESTGQEGRRDALAVLHAVDREVDGTRLTGQAAYGFQPDDPTSEPLDVAGYTSYFGVFYGDEPRADTVKALDVMHATFPRKPVMVLEMGRWADGPDGERLQREILEETAAAVDARDAHRPGGFVAAAVWWALEDYWTMRPNIDVEHFGLFAPGGERRPAGDAAAELFGPVRAGEGTELETASSGRARAVTGTVRVGGLLLVGYVGFGLLVMFGLLAVALRVLLMRSPRPAR
jgi:beta-glucuronidase